MHSVNENETVTKDISAQVTREMFHEAPRLQYLDLMIPAMTLLKAKWTCDRLTFGVLLISADSTIRRLR